MCCLINTVCCMQCRYYIPAAVPASPLFQPTRSSNSVREFSDSEIQIFVLVQESWPDRQSNAGRPGYWVGQLRMLWEHLNVSSLWNNYCIVFTAYSLPTNCVYMHQVRNKKCRSPLTFKTCFKLTNRPWIIWKKRFMVTCPKVQLPEESIIRLSDTVMS
jgi:hypothetical protein